MISGFSKLKNLNRESKRAEKDRRGEVRKNAFRIPGLEQRFLVNNNKKLLKNKN
jgi:hypothetical protein